MEGRLQHLIILCRLIQCCCDSEFNFEDLQDTEDDSTQIEKMSLHASFSLVRSQTFNTISTESGEKLTRLCLARFDSDFYALILYRSFISLSWGRRRAAFSVLRSWLAIGSCLQKQDWQYHMKESSAPSLSLKISFSTFSISTNPNHNHTYIA